MVKHEIRKIQELNHDLLKLIFCHLTIRDIHNFMISNKATFEYCTSDLVYESIFMKKKGKKKSLANVSNNFRKELVKYSTDFFNLDCYSKQELMDMDMNIDLFAHDKEEKLMDIDMNTDLFDKKEKIVIVGEGAVGKSIFLFRCLNPKEDIAWNDVAFEMFTIDCLFYELEHLTISLWDTNGREDHDRLRPLCYPDTGIFLLAYSIVQRSSFLSIKEKFIKEVRHHQPNASCVLLACKIDLRNDSECLKILEEKDETPVTYEEGLKLAKDLKCLSFIETSSKAKEGFEDIGDFFTRLFYIRKCKNIGVVTTKQSKKCYLQ